MDDRRSRVLDRFRTIYYGSSDQTWNSTQWLGHRMLKCPMDLWMYQELFHRLTPDLVVETGTYQGGSAYYFATLFDLLGRGEIITVDVDTDPSRPIHPRITYLTGSSTADEVVAQVRERTRAKQSVVVILDSDHSELHVSRELALYSPLVTPGSYLVVEDTCVNGHPVFPEFGPGPMEAVEAFLATTDEFEVDRSLERHLITFNPNGWLKRREQ